VDFVVASFIGFLCYAIFTCSMYWNPSIQAAYMGRHDGEESLVELNDVIFTLHATCINLVYILQVVLYRKLGESLSRVGAGSSILITIAAGITLVLSLVGIVPWLDFLYLLSYIKLMLTVVKYIPQVYMNYLRKSTLGWSIINVMLDFAGGVFSIMQILLDCWISGHWSGITGFLIKFALGIVTLFFDTIFLLQHYVWFPLGCGPHLVDMQEAKDADLVDAEGNVLPGNETTGSITSDTDELKAKKVYKNL